MPPPHGPQPAEAKKGNVPKSAQTLNSSFVRPTEGRADEVAALVYFPTGSYELDAQDKAALDQIADEANTDLLGRTVTITVDGYADERGTEAANDILASQRAFAVEEYLQAKVNRPDSNRFIVLPVSHGESESTDDQLSDRRVTVSYKATGREQKVKPPREYEKPGPMKDIQGGTPRRKGSKVVPDIDDNAPTSPLEQPWTYIKTGAGLRNAVIGPTILGGAIVIAGQLLFIGKMLELLGTDRNAIFARLLGICYGSVQIAHTLGPIAEIKGDQLGLIIRLLENTEVARPGGVPKEFKNDKAYSEGYNEAAWATRQALVRYAKTRIYKQQGKKVSREYIDRANGIAPFMNAVRQDKDATLDASIKQHAVDYMGGKHFVYYKLMTSTDFTLY